MISLDADVCRLAVQDYMCPVCSIDLNYEANWKILQVNANLIYCRCNHFLNCNTAYKFRRRKIRDRKDVCGWEYIIKTNEDLFYGVRGYQISTITFDKIFQKYNTIINYFRYGANEIDDLFKEILQDDKEIIQNIVGRDFSDEKYF